MTQKEIAEAFSKGKFDMVYPYLTDTIQWKVVGQDYFDGKNAVTANCEQVGNYFESITTDFRTLNIIEENNIVVVNGTAEFIREGKCVSFISACDVYEFNNHHKLQTITSYCIQTEK
jgi:ketosteroid isomerase-like protein